MRSKLQHGPASDRCESRSIHKESDSVTSFVLEPIDGQPLPVFQAGQFVVLRLLVDPNKPPVLRSYSLSDLPVADHFRISVKSELNGIGSSFLCNRTREGDVLDVSAPRGSFTLRPSQNPVVLLSAGVGRNARDVDAAHTRRRKIATRGLVDLWSAQPRRPSICRRIAFATETALSRTRIRRVQQARCDRPNRSRLRCSRAH